MIAELLVNVTPAETRVALIEGGALQEIHIERDAKRGIVGNIYKGKVSRILPGMQAAFIDIGLERCGFVQNYKSLNKDSKQQFQLFQIVSFSKRL